MTALLLFFTYVHIMYVSQILNWYTSDSVSLASLAHQLETGWEGGKSFRQQNVD